MIQIAPHTVMLIGHGHTGFITQAPVLCRECGDYAKVFINRHGSTRCEDCDHNKEIHGQSLQA